MLQEVEDWEDHLEHQHSGMEQVMLTKATELFRLCDTEGKVTRHSPSTSDTADKSLTTPPPSIPT